ncbi:MAG: hypothetical protein M0R22_00940 [Dehalococcoidia bacterium]|jgi:hypothetical protein|nr:hypothetical protein [Dehalococcoidia bacterium]
MKTIYLLVNAVPYEGVDILRAYRKRDDAEARMNTLRRSRERWEDRQRALEVIGSGDTWMSPPHDWTDLDIWPVKLQEARDA